MTSPMSQPVLPNRVIAATSIGSHELANRRASSSTDCLPGLYAVERVAGAQYATNVLLLAAAVAAAVATAAGTHTKYGPIVACDARGTTRLSLARIAIPFPTAVTAVILARSSRRSSLPPVSPLPVAPRSIRAFSRRSTPVPPFPSGSKSTAETIILAKAWDAARRRAPPSSGYERGGCFHDVEEESFASSSRDRTARPFRVYVRRSRGRAQKIILRTLPGIVRREFTISRRRSIIRE